VIKDRIVNLIRVVKGTMLISRVLSPVPDTTSLMFTNMINKYTCH